MEKVVQQYEGVPPPVVPFFDFHSSLPISRSHRNRSCRSGRNDCTTCLAAVALAGGQLRCIDVVEDAAQHLRFGDHPEKRRRYSGGRCRPRSAGPPTDWHPPDRPMPSRVKPCAHGGQVKHDKVKHSRAQQRVHPWGNRKQVCRCSARRVWQAAFYVHIAVLIAQEALGQILLAPECR